MNNHHACSEPIIINSAEKGLLKESH